MLEYLNRENVSLWPSNCFDRIHNYNKLSENWCCNQLVSIDRRIKKKLALSFSKLCCWECEHEIRHQIRWNYNHQATYLMKTHSIHWFIVCFFASFFFVELCKGRVLLIVWYCLLSMLHESIYKHNRPTNILLIFLTQCCVFFRQNFCLRCRRKSVIFYFIHFRFETER